MDAGFLPKETGCLMWVASDSFAHNIEKKKEEEEEEKEGGEGRGGGEEEEEEEDEEEEERKKERNKDFQVLRGPHMMMNSSWSSAFSVVPNLWDSYLHVVPSRLFCGTSDSGSDTILLLRLGSKRHL
ncbi:hypothetical protein H920_16447 [Fukomys damarensis]|uniref:Uncharacterized protein n=1 Tax=Fukomys damarensis TaxID=885580 RepID=A0A091CVM6_FUKDA|nr:hypothetical protein H920_16447 [Fukomys damarensis]